MSERFLGSPEDLAANTISAFKEEAASNKLRSEILVEGGHSLEDPDDDAAIHQRMAEVIMATAEEIEVIMKKYRRDIERAMNPYFKDYSDAEIDRIIERHNRTMADIRDHHGALR